MKDSAKISILFVCMGNICRSPTAEGVFRQQAETAGLAPLLHIDSAGTQGYHAGEAPDRRSQAAAARRGYDLGSIRARGVAAVDFERFDLILAMDEQNRASLLARCPAEHTHKLQLLLDYSARFPCQQVPDPYYGGNFGFERVLDMVEDAATGLLAHLRSRLAQR